MAAKKTGLGRGLDALLGNTAPAAPTGTPAPQPATANPQTDRPASTPAQGGSAAPAVTAGLKNLPLDLLQPGAYQPRRDMHRETLEELAELYAAGTGLPSGRVTGAGTACRMSSSVAVEEYGDDPLINS